MIRNQHAFHQARALDYRIFNSWFPGKCGLQDIDGTYCGWAQSVSGTIELNGRFFYMETKGQDAPLQRGQAIYWHRRIGKDQGDSILFVLHTDSRAKIATLESVRSFYTVYVIDGQVVATGEIPADCLEAWVKAWVAFCQGRDEHFPNRVSSQPTRRFIEGEK